MILFLFTLVFASGKFFVNVKKPLPKKNLMSDYLISPSTGFMWNKIQRPLSRAQPVPVIGLVPSALKAAISTVQLVSGFVFATLLGAATVGCFHCKFDKVIGITAEYAGIAGVHALMGFNGLVYSLLSIASLGAVAYYIEDIVAGRQPEA